MASTCLLSCLLTYFLGEKYREEGVFSIYFEMDGEGCTLDNTHEDISQTLQAYFHIKDAAALANAHTHLNRLLSSLGKTLELRRPFMQPNLQRNLYLLQKIYGKRVSEDVLD